MKLTNSQTMKRKSGMTLLELTVVILVLLSLISILFIGARAWKRGSDRAGCILNQRNTQQAVRSYANMNNLNPGDSASGWKAKIVGQGLFIEKEPDCPAPDGGYTWAADTEIPALGTLAIVCDLSADPDNHQPADSDGW